MLGLVAGGLIMVDIHVQYNSHIIVQLGNWIYSAYEKGSVFGWEAYLRNGIPWFHSSIPNKLATGATFMPSMVMLLAFYVSLVLQVSPINSRLVLLQKTIFVFVQWLCISFFVLNNLLLTNDHSWYRWAWVLCYTILWGLITLSSPSLWIKRDSIESNNNLENNSPTKR